MQKFAPIWYHYIKSHRIHQLSKFIQERGEEPAERFSWRFSLTFSQQRLLSCEMEGKIKLCTKVCSNMIPLHQTSSNSPTFEVHSEERRGAHRKILIEILTKILTIFISIHINYIKLRQYHFIWKVLTSCRQHFTVHCKHKIEKDISRHQEILYLILSFYPHIKAVSQYLCFVEHCR